MGKTPSSHNKKIANGLVAAGTAAVLSVYAAGYAKTRSAADKFDAESAERRPSTSQGRGAAPTPVTAENAVAARAIAGHPSQDTAAAPVEVAKVQQLSMPVGNESLPVKSAPPATSQVSPATPAPLVENKIEIATLAPAAPVPAITTAPVATQAATPVIAPVAASLAPPAPAPPAVPQAVAAKYKDGTYTGWGTCRHGDIQASVLIENGRITSATISQCLTRYSCNVIGRLPPEVAQRQSAEVDYVSGATQSTNAFYYAVIEALAKAK